MTKKLLKTLEREIEKCKIQLRELEPNLCKNAGVAETYNRLLVKKAILTDKYKKLSEKKSAIKRLFGMLKIKKGPKLICDYFPNT